MSVLTNDYILFLDIDGVLNDEHRAPDNFLPDAVWVINELYSRHKAKVVLSSAWKDSWTFDDLKDLFQRNGLQIKILDKTPTFIGCKAGSDAIKAEEISSYVALHDVQHYAILDDVKMDNEELQKHLVQTNFSGDNTGLQIKHLPIIEKILGV